MANKQLEQFFAPQEVADRLHIDVSTVWRLVKKGRISPVHKIGHATTRIPESAVTRFMESCQVDGVTE